MIRNNVSAQKRAFAKTLRRNQTSAEDCLWQKLRRKQLSMPFRRQTIIRGYIVDFYCARIHLVVEVDGASHFGQEAYDRNRDAVLAKLGIETIRFSNSTVLADCDSVVDQIRAALRRRIKLSIKRFHGPIPEEIKASWLQRKNSCGIPASRDLVPLLIVGRPNHVFCKWLADPRLLTSGLLRQTLGVLFHDE
jgi:very-short-patch-repair endonuclease